MNLKSPYLVNNKIKKTPMRKKSSKKKNKKGKHYPYIWGRESKSKSLLGGGFFGETYIMKNKLDKQTYAVKHININKIQTILTLLKSKPYSKNQTLEFILNESKILAGFNHPNIVRYYNTKCKKDIVYITLELMNGGNLETAIVNKYFFTKPSIIYNIIQQICSGLSYLHKNNILHRDIKSSNILIETNNWDNPKIKLGDFGLSCLLETSKYQQSGNSTGAGDMFYRSPEASQGKPYGRGDDNWAVGVIILELVSSMVLSSLVSGKIFSQYKNFDEYVETIIEDYCQPCEKDSYYDRIIIITRGLLEKDPEKRLTSEKVVFEKMFDEKPFVPTLSAIVRRTSATVDSLPSITTDIKRPNSV